VEVAIDCPDEVTAGSDVPVRVVITSNKVGHDFPTGPLDIIQSWINLEVTDEAGNVVYVTGDLDEGHFIRPGSFMFKAEPVDRYGNLIDRHNLWEMVGVRFRRALFPGFSDAATFSFACPSEMPAQGEVASYHHPDDPVEKRFRVETAGTSELTIRAHLDYRKADQFLLNFMFGEESGLTSPVIRMASDEKVIRVL
jgi:hypothetical protein